MAPMQQVSTKELKIILTQARDALSVPGDFVELGCYRGDTSLELQKLLRGAQKKTLWLYDSFEGLPEKTSKDFSPAGTQFQTGTLDVSKKEVILRFKKAGLRVPRIKKAWFSDLAPGDLPEKIAFAFLDGDFYESIKVSLHLVIPRLSPGGIVLVHDYNNPELPGASKAVDEFFSSDQIRTQETLAIISE